MQQKVKAVEYMCKYCGTRHRRTAGTGRPLPGICPRRTRNMPHIWVINRNLY